MSDTINYIQSIRAEWMKSKSVSVISLLAFCVLFVIVIVLIANYMDVYNRVSFNENPWDRYFIGGMAIYVLFVTAPFLILLTGAIAYIEEKANGWKMIYTMNVSRTQTYLAKLTIIIALFLFASIVLALLLILSAYALNFLLPEYEFSYYSPDIWYLSESILNVLLSSLGAIALQFMISMMTNNVILSLGIGLFAYILGFILAFSDTTFVFYNPYALMMVNQDFGAIDTEIRKEVIDGVLTNVECYSLLFFALFTTIGCIYETRKNVY